MLLEKELLCT